MSGRRGFLGHVAGFAAVATAVTVDPQQSSAASLSKLRDLHGHYLMAVAGQEMYDAKSDDMRTQLVAQWGDLESGEGGESRWGHDPRHAELVEAIDKCDQFSDLRTRLADEIAEFPVFTPADIIAKLQIALGFWEKSDGVMDDPDFHQIMAYGAMKDAERFLSVGGLA